MKPCTKCGIEKVLTDFHKRGNSFRSVCKECRKSENEANRVRASKYYRENTDKVLASNKSWKQRNMQKMMEYKNSWRSRNKVKALAHWAVSNALRNGKLVKAPCEVCGDKIVQAHHDDYLKKLDVNWLCDHHHKERHGVLING